MKDIDFLKNKFIAHRGVYDNINTPENTIMSFKKSIYNNCIIELDIQITKDNNLIVFHDYNLKRMTNINKLISSCNYKEIEKIKLLNTNHSIPLFEEVLKVVKGKTPLLIEIKTSTKNNILVDKIIKILDDYEGEVAIQSFDFSILKSIKKYRPSFKVGLLISDNINNLKLILYNYIFKYDFISYNKKLYNKTNKNIFSLSWTINNKEEYNKYKKYYNNLICNNIEKEFIDKETI